MNDFDLTYKVAKAISGATYTKPINIVTNYKLVPSDYNFVINNDEDVTSFMTLQAFFSLNRISYKVFRDSLSANILPDWSGLTTIDKENLAYNRIYPSGYTKTDIENLIGVGGYEYIIDNVSEYEFGDDLHLEHITYTALTNSNFNYISGITDTKLEKVDFTGYTATTSVDISGKLNTSVFTGYSATTLNSINSRLLTTDFNSFTGITLPSNYYDKTQINSYSALTATQINSKIDKVTGATGNLAIFKNDGNVEDSGVTIDSITGGTGYYFYTDKKVNQQTTSAAEVVYLEGTSTLSQGTWSVDFNAIGGNLQSNKWIGVSFHIDGVEQGINQYFKTNDATVTVSFTLTKDLVLSAGSHVFQIRFYANGGTAFLQYGSIRARIVK